MHDQQIDQTPKFVKEFSIVVLWIAVIVFVALGTAMIMPHLN